MSDPKTMELTTKPAQNLANVMLKKLPDFLAVAAPNVRADQNWLARAQLEIMSKPETANLMLKTRGLETAVYAIMRAATVGINFGGTKPQAYFVPAGDGVRLDVSQFGYAHAAVYGPGAVLSHIPELIKVHENDGTKMNQATGEIIFPPGGIDPFGERGKLVGYMMRLEFKDGRQAQVVTITQAKVMQIAQQYGQVNGPAYKKSDDQMYEKVAVKQMLKRAYAESEGNAQNALDWLDEAPAAEGPAKVERDPLKRMERQMQGATTAMKTAESAEEPVVEDEPEPEAAHADEPATDGKPPEELF